MLLRGYQLSVGVPKIIFFLLSLLKSFKPPVSLGVGENSSGSGETQNIVTFVHNEVRSFLYRRTWVCTLNKSRPNLCKSAVKKINVYTL